MGKLDAMPPVMRSADRSQIHSRLRTHGEMQSVWRQDPTVNRRTSCEHAWRHWECAKVKVKQVVHTVEVTCSKSSRREVRNSWGEEAQDHQDESAERDNLTTSRKANHEIKQMETL